MSSEPQTSGEWLPPRAPTPEPSGSSQAKRTGVGAALLAIVLKGKALLLLLPKIKFLTTSATMLVSIAAYAVIWGWKFAVGFVLLLFVHEMGHVIQLRREGVEASAPVFIPFMGALVWAKSLGNDAAAEARVGLAGPILGSLGAAACWAVYGLTGYDFWLALAFTGFFLNLFNLLPVTPLDGGRAMAAISPRGWFVGLFLIVVLVFLIPNPIIVLIAIMAAFDVYHRWKRLKAGETAAYHQVSGRTRTLVAVVYLGLIVLLVVAMGATHLERDL